jgi:hypothetical protein
MEQSKAMEYGMRKASPILLKQRKKYIYPSSLFSTGQKHRHFHDLPLNLQVFHGRNPFEVQVTRAPSSDSSIPLIYLGKSRSSVTAGNTILT